VLPRAPYQLLAGTNNVTFFKEANAETHPSQMKHVSIFVMYAPCILYNLLSRPTNE